jgi:hypothetical protein
MEPMLRSGASFTLKFIDVCKVGGACEVCALQSVQNRTDFRDVIQVPEGDILPTPYW